MPEALLAQLCGALEFSERYIANTCHHEQNALLRAGADPGENKEMQKQFHDLQMVRAALQAARAATTR